MEGEGDMKCCCTIVISGHKSIQFGIDAQSWIAIPGEYKICTLLDSSIKQKGAVTSQVYKC